MNHTLRINRAMALLRNVSDELRGTGNAYDLLNADKIRSAIDTLATVRENCNTRDRVMARVKENCLIATEPHGENNNCDGSGPHTIGQVRVLPTGGDSNGILCHACYCREINYRIDRNRDLSPDCQFKLPAWDSLKVYGAS